MTAQYPSWSYNDFLAYLLLFAAVADFKITPEEKEFLFSRVDIDNYEHIHKEFDKANDYERLQTIMSFREKYFGTDEQKLGLFNDLKDMFLADDHYPSVEKAIFTGLKRILK